MRRVVIVLADGLRPDAISPTHMPSLDALSRTYTMALHDHAEPHPVNDRIPLILAGPGVTRRHQLTRSVSLLDIPPTVLWWSGVEVPASYEGRVVSQAFTRVPGGAEAAV